MEQKTKTIYDRPSPQLRKEIGSGVPSLVLKKKWIPRPGVYRLVLKVVCVGGLEGWMDP